MNYKNIIYFMIYLHCNCLYNNKKNIRYTYDKDYYSLGCILYEMVALKQPFMGEGGIKVTNVVEAFFHSFLMSSFYKFLNREFMMKYLIIIFRMV
jgi:serine/threonine protein kinase